MSATAYDFTGLTPPQQRLLTFQGWEPGSRCGPQPRPSTAAVLVRRGLAVEREVTFIGVRIKAYDVPISVHIAWCNYCAEKD